MDIYLILFVCGAIAFTISTVGGGGGALMLLPIVKYLLGATQTAPVVQLANFIGRPVRLFLFWKHIDWRVVTYYLPAALIGGGLGAYFFTRISSHYIELILGIFLVSTIVQYRFGKKKQSFPIHLTYFAPLGFTTAFISSIVGGLGPVLNPFYLNYGLEKEDMIATKTANSFFVGIVQIGTYSVFGALQGKMWMYGLILGGGIAMGNYLGKLVLSRISTLNFRRIVIAVMVITGLQMIWSVLASS